MLTFYAWDAYQRLATADPVAGRVTYAYDVTGKRVTKQTPTATRKYLYDFENLLRESDGSDLLWNN